MPHVGLEVTTLRLRISCSIDWVSQVPQNSNIFRNLFAEKFTIWLKFVTFEDSLNEPISFVVWIDYSIDFQISKVPW